MRAPTADLADDLDRDLFVDDAPEPGSFDADEDEPPPHADLGYESPARSPLTTAKPAPHVEVRSVAPPEYVAQRGVCQRCQAGFDVPGGVALHQPQGRVEHTICAGCSGKRNREIVEQTRECIRDLKAAVAIGHDGDAATAMVTLRALVGDHQAEETHKAIRQKHEEKPAGKGGRR